MNIFKKAKILCLFLSLLMVLSCLLTSCKDDSGNHGGESTSGEATTGKAPAETKEPEPKDAVIEDWVPVQDYGKDGGATEINYLFFNDYATNYMLIQQDDSEDPLRSSAYSRTMKIQEKFNIYLKEIEVPDVTGTLQASLMGGGGDFDLVYPHPDNVTPIMQNGLATNLHTYENLHLDQPWWNSSVETYTIDGHLYFAAADYSMCGQGLVAMIYNRDLFKQLQLDYDIYDMVENKEWTIEAFREIVMKYGTDVDGNDKYDLNDKYGFMFCGATHFYWAMGGKLVEKDDNNDYHFMLDVDQVSTMAELLCNLVFDTDHKTFRKTEATNWGNFANSQTWAAYATGNSLFMDFEIGAFFHLLPNLTFDLGYAPLPLLNSEQDDYHSICGAGFFVIPRKTSDPTRNSIILEALCIESYADFRPTFFHTILLGRLSNVEEDYKMLERLHESKVYDLGYTWSRGGSGSVLGIAIEDRNPEAIASYIQGRWKEMNETMDFIEEVRSGLYSVEE